MLNQPYAKVYLMHLSSLSLFKKWRFDGLFKGIHDTDP